MNKPIEPSVLSGEQRLRRLYETTPVMLQSLDAAGKIRMVSDTWLARLGYTRDEVLGRPASDFLMRQSKEYVRNVARSILFKTGTCTDIELQLVRKNGEALNVLMSATVDGRPDGLPQGRVVVIEDLARRRGVEHALVEERWRLSKLIEATDVGTWQWNVQTGAFRVNKRWADIVGRTLDELEPLSIQTRLDLLHPDDLQRSLGLLERHFAGADPHHEFEARMRHRDGHFVWVLSRGTVMSRTADGKPEWMFGSLKDISGRKGQEEALRKSEDFQERTGRLAGVGGWDLDLATGAMTWSAEARRIHGMAADHKPSLEDAINIYAPEARPAIRAALDAGMADGSFWDLELPVIRADGDRVWVRAVGSVTFAGGKPARLSGAFQDITPRVAERAALRKAHERLDLVADSCGIGVWEWNVADDVMTWDARMCRLYGMPPHDGVVTRTKWKRHLHPDDAAAAGKAVQEGIDGIRPFDSEFRIVDADGNVRHIKGRGQVTRDEAGRALRIAGANWDVTEQRELAADVVQQHELLRVTLGSIGDGVITADAEGYVTWLNPVAERMTGWSAAETVGRTLSEVFHILHEESRQPVENLLAACVAQGPVAGAENTMLISRTGDEYGIADSAVPMRDARGDIRGMVLVFRDVTEHRRLSGEMSYTASHDALTGLVNRVEFENRLRRLLLQTQADHRESALIAIDLDHFKVVNDTCGHAVGDQLLKHVAALLKDVVRASDTLARLGGDEFAIILNNCAVAPAQRLAQRICDRMGDFRFVQDGQRFQVGASVGLVPIDDHWATTAVVLQAADAARDAAKDAGRNRVHVWCDTDQPSRARPVDMQWATRLELALNEGRFMLFAQPLQAVRLGERKLHAEVLLRMLDSDGSLVPPNTFLPAAERFHLASRIDRWVLNQAILWLRSAPSLDDVGSLSVKLSGQSVGDKSFHRWTLDTLLEAGKHIRGRLCLEITETAAVTNLGDAAAFVERVRAVGARVALDDFGAGGFSFDYLKSMPVDILKIDGHFIRDLVQNPLHEAAVRCFVEIAKLTGMTTVAEFVDSQPLLDKLGAMGIDYAQGYLIHRPVPIDELMVVGSGSSLQRWHQPASLQ